jgi:hypothetical protein
MKDTPLFFENANASCVQKRTFTMVITSHNFLSGYGHVGWRAGEFLKLYRASVQL